MNTSNEEIVKVLQEIFDKRKDTIKDKLIQVYEDISYDINTVWDDSYEDDCDRIATIKSILSFFNNNSEVKEELIDLIKYYVYRLYEEVKYE